MKVLEKGPGWNLKLRCTGKGNGDGGCNSLLLVEEEDLYITSHTYIDGETDYYYTFACPVCGAETDVDENQLPHRICVSLLNDYKSKRYQRRIR